MAHLSGNHELGHSVARDESGRVAGLAHQLAVDGEDHVAASDAIFLGHRAVDADLDPWTRGSAA
eukprot:3763304-Prymnesium_polylepis.1